MPGYQAVITKDDETAAARGRRLYGNITGRKVVYLLIVGTLLAAALVVDVLVGPSNLSIARVLETIGAPRAADAPTWTIVWLIRLPAALMAVVVGASLAVAGVEMQTILGNPLASPYTLGIASAAGFGAALALVLGIGVLPTATELLAPVNAFLFALLCSFAVYGVARARRATVETLVLTGIAFHFLFSSLLALLEYFATQEELQAVVFWLFGSLTKATWARVAVVAGILVVALPLLARDAWTLTALRLGETKAESLGVNVKRIRREVLVLSAILTATATAFVGTIGFVGLVAPHVTRMLVGEDQRFLMPLAALMGALLLSVASITSKVLVQGVVFPIGIVTSFVGVPFFLSLILTGKRRHW
jgi:iron complex transport system permease protein